MPESNPSEEPFLKEVRDNVIDMVTLLASAEEQRQYEIDVPIAHVPGELVEMWHLFNADEPRLRVLFDDEEWDALLRIDDAVAAFLKKNPYFNINSVAELQSQSEWQLVIVLAQRSLKILPHQ